MKEVRINSSRPYDVIISDNAAGFAEEIAELVGDGSIFFVCDENTKKISKDVGDELCEFPIQVITVKNGEECKTFAEYKRLTTKLARLGADRTDVLVSFGGGALSDLVGFVAATYMRGIKHVAIPTTILSAVDASVGGKTAINLPEGKNLVGAFYSPSLALVDYSAFETLPQREVESGFGEIVKYAFLDKRVAAEDIRNGITEDLIALCVEIKKDAVEKDEFEQGGREILNLGHTIGHALEAQSGFSLSHGLCVAFGIDKIIDISADFYGLSEQKVKEMKSLLNSYPFNFDFGFEVDYRDLKSRILFDKKIVAGDKIKLVLIKDIGDVRIEVITIAELWSMLK